MIRTRRVVAILCIAAILVTGAMPGSASLLVGVLVPLGPLFGAVVAMSLPRSADAPLPAAPIRPSLASRAPPRA